MRRKFITTLMLASTISFNLPIYAQEDKALSGQVADRFTEAQEILLQAKGSYKTIKMQEEAIENMRKATNLSLKAARLRAKAERLQHKADVLVNKANLAALSRGLYITNPLAPAIMTEPPPVVVEPSKTPVSPPVPGNPINIAIPKEQERVVYKQEIDSDTLPEPPQATNDF